MKQLTNLRRKSTLLLLTLVALFAGGVSPAWGDELTICDGAGSSTYYPVHGNYADTNNSLSEFIVPATSLTAMNGASISKMTFYISSVAAAKWTSTFTVYMKEITTSAYEGSSAIGDEGATVVYIGELDGTASTMDVNFTTNYDYGGGNLLIGFKVTSATSVWKSATFVGETQSTYTAFRNQSSSTREKFIPKTTFTYSAASISGPAFTVKDGSTKLKSPYTYNFGLATAGTTKTFTLSNPGTEATPISVDVSDANGFTAAIEDNATSIPAGGEKTLTITMPDATAIGSIVVTPTGDGLSAFTFNISGTKRDASKVYESGFTSLPEDWTTSGSWYYSAANGAYTTVWYLSSNARLITPKLTIAEGEKFFVEAKGYSTSYTSYQHLQMQYSADGSTWTNFGDEPTLDPSNWNTFEITGCPAGSYYIAINASQADIRMFYGGQLPLEPKMVVTQPATLDFGLYDKDASPAPTKTFTIANTGLATLNGINVTSGNAAFTITNAPTSLAAGASQEVTITMATATTGALSSLITVSATEMTDATFTVTGTVKPAGMPVEDFSGTTIPSNWTSSGSWSFATDGVATGTSGTAYLYTPKLKFSAGDFIIIKAKNSDGDASDYITVSGSVNEGSDDYAAYSKKITVTNSSDYATFVVTDIPTTVNKIRFTGGWVIVDEIYGLTYAPQLSVTTGDPAQAVTTPAAYDFGETTANASVTYNFANSGSGTINISNVAITGEGAAAYSTNWTETIAAPFDLVITRTYDAGRAGAAAMEAVVTVTTSEGDFVINVTGTDKAANQPEMDFYIADAVEKSTTGADLDFGLAAKGSTKSIKIKNDGTGALSITDITVPAGYTLKDGENAVATPLAVAAGANKTLTLTLNEYGKQSGTLNFTAADIAEPFTFELSGAAYDDTALSFDFNDQKIPTDWTTTGGWSSYNDGNDGYCRENAGTSQSMTTQKVTVTDGEVMIFQTRRYSDSNTPALTISYCATADGEFITPENATFGAEDTPSASAWATQVVSTIPAGDWFIRFTGTYIDVDNVHMYHASQNDPKMGVYATFDGESTYSNAVTSGTTKYLTWSQDAQSFTYYIKNDNTGTLTINEVTNSNETDFTTTVVNESNKNIAAGAALAFTVTMNAASVGEKTGTITLNTNVGNFGIPVKGFVYGDRNLVDFTDAAQYQGWSTEGWTISEGIASPTNSYSAVTMQTMPFTVDANEPLYVDIKGTTSSVTKSFSYSYSTDGGDSWINGEQTISASTYVNVADQVLTLSDIADAEAERTVLIRFTSQNLGINHIYGFEALTAPLMTLDKTAESYNFNMQTANEDYVITVTNTGTAPLTNLAAALTTGTNYTVTITKPEGESTTTISEGKATVPAGQQAVITVTQVFDANNGLASLSDVLTISGDDVASKVINLSGQTRDGSKWYVDFASSIPSSFVEKGSWSVSSQQAYVYSESALVSQTLTIAANEKVQFDAKKMSYGTASLKVRYSLNGGLSWSDYTDFTDTEDFNSSAYKTMQYSIGNTDASAVAMIEFLGANVYLDNIYGGTLNNDAPMIQVKKSSTVVASGVTEEFSSIFDETSAEYTIKNIGAGTLTITSPITTVTGVATAAVNATSLANGESATLTITMPVEAPYGEKSGAVTVKTSLGDFVINYTATTMNPNALNVDFSDYTLPTGWYANGWTCTYTQYMSRSDRNSDTDFITQKLNVAGTSDVLKFDAQKYGSYYASSTVLKVSYSTDRVNWTEIDDYASEMTTSWKTFSISGLDAGEYYLKFSGRYASVDNIIGWTKVAGIDHDLYVTATSFPAATDKGESATISATVTSLRSGETGVYAKLFINGKEEATADAQDINLNATKTFSFTYAIPENKKAQIKVYYNSDTEAFATAENDMKVNYAFSQTEDNSTVSKGTFDVQLTYTKAEKSLGTICLPFATTTEELSGLYGTTVKIYEMYSFADNVITFTGVDELTAGTPYLIYSEDEMSGTQTFADKEISAATAGSVTESNVTFHGLYAPVTASNWGSDWYGVTSEGKIAPGTSTTTMKALRGYFTGAVASARIFITDDEVVTGIGDISSKMADGADSIYNLSGQKMNKAQKGLYIINGKKVFVK